MFNSTVDACNHFGKFEHHSAISKCATKIKNNTLFGYFWRYIKDYDPLEDFEALNYSKHGKKYNNAKIIQTTQCGEFIKIWNSVSEIINALGVSKGIYRNIKNNKLYNGYYWSII